MHTNKAQISKIRVIFCKTGHFFSVSKKRQRIPPPVFPASCAPAFVMVFYHQCNSKNVKSIHGIVLLLAKLQASACPLVMLCAIWYHFCNLKNMKNTLGGVKLQVFDCTLLISLQLITYFKLHKWYQIVQSIIHNQPVFNCSQLTIKTLEQGVKYVQS